MKKLYNLTMLLFCAVVSSKAQSASPQTVNVCGGYANTGYYQFEWSIGEMAVIETFGNSTDGYLTNGVLQPLTDKPSGSILDNNWDVSEIKIFPSPTRGNFEVNIMTKQQGFLIIQLMDSKGQMVAKRSSYYYGFGRIERFNIANNSSSNYILRIVLSPNPGFSKKNGAFKILKIN